MPSPIGKAIQTCIVMGTARSNGNTVAVVSHLRHHLGARCNVADLSQLTIEPFQYGRHADRDDFRTVVRLILESDHVVFATPVYWYAMAGSMKLFFDRLTDLLLDPEARPMGRALAGRSVWLLATGADEGLPPGFHEPFARTAGYFGMAWQRAVYCRAIKGMPLTDDMLTETEKLARLIYAERPQAESF